jgi:peptidoglycan/xylan/chitin deacetylase (PgdA/CDA1 family)
MFWRIAGRIASQKPVLGIFSYHRVLAKKDPLEPDYPDAQEFSRQIASAKSLFKILPLEDAVEEIRSGKAKQHMAAITFDDGYADNYHVALPVLRHHKVPATIFVATAYLNGKPFFPDLITESIRHSSGTSLDLADLGLPLLAIGTLQEKRNSAHFLHEYLKYRAPGERDALAARISERLTSVPARRLMLTPDEALSMHRGGVTLGLHTHEHTILSTISDSELRAELKINSEVIKDITGRAPHSFAYPNGRRGTDFSTRHPDILKEYNVKVAVTTENGFVAEDCDPLLLPRVTTWDKSRYSFSIRNLLGISSPPPVQKFLTQN